MYGLKTQLYTFCIVEIGDDEWFASRFDRFNHLGNSRLHTSPRPLLTRIRDLLLSQRTSKLSGRSEEEIIHLSLSGVEQVFLGCTARGLVNMSATPAPGFPQRAPCVTLPFVGGSPFNSFGG